VLATRTQSRKVSNYFENILRSNFFFVKVPTSTNALVELMNMVEKWRNQTDYGPVVVVST